jgi:hypothetical protein
LVSQIGEQKPIGAKTAIYKTEFGNFTDLQACITAGMQKGVQRPVLTPGSLLPLHPIAFLVITQDRVYGKAISPDLVSSNKSNLSYEDFGLKKEQLALAQIPKGHAAIIKTQDGDPLSGTDIAGRLGDFEDVRKMESKGDSDPEIIQKIFSTSNTKHQNYQDYQAFLDNGGKMGLQHDLVLSGTYAWNPFLIDYEPIEMLVVSQGQVAVIKAFVGLPTEDTSGESFKYGSLVRPGHKGIWQTALGPNTWPINPLCYQWEIVPTSILTLNWAAATSKAHDLDKQLSQIDAKSREGFLFKIDLQVQIHVPDKKAPKVISAVGTMQNLVNEVLQAAVGNLFRDKLQSMQAIKFVETRQAVQNEAEKHIAGKLQEYDVETKGVYIQDVILPEELIRILKDRELANQEKETFDKQKIAQDARTDMENSKGTADMQAELAASKVNIDIKANQAEARKKEADGEAYYVRETGKAQGEPVKAVGLAHAEAYEAQVKALGQNNTTAVNVATALAGGSQPFMPQILIISPNGGAMDGLAATLTQLLSSEQGLGNVLKGLNPAIETKPTGELNKEQIATGTDEYGQIEEPKDLASSMEPPGDVEHKGAENKPTDTGMT